jgi:hypothetical protein
VNVWDIEAGQLRATLKANVDQSADLMGKLCAQVGRELGIAIWDVNTAKLLHESKMAVRFATSFASQSLAR